MKDIKYEPKTDAVCMPQILLCCVIASLAHGVARGPSVKRNSINQSKKISSLSQKPSIWMTTMISNIYYRQ